MFLEIARAAYALGATYFYRLNDDTEMLRPWASSFVDALQACEVVRGFVGFGFWF